jgi:hypothetical protein
MSLTTRTNGSGPGNIIQASWWNEYKDLLTGNMQDQQVKIQNGLQVKAIGTAPGSAPTLTAQAGSNLGVGIYTYAVSFGCTDGESLVGPTTTITTTSGNTNVALSALPIGPTGCNARHIYRSKVNNTQLFRLASLFDNTATTYTDSTSDAALSTTNKPDFPSFGGHIQLKDSAGNIKWTLYSDGHCSGGTYFIPPNWIVNNASINSGATATIPCTGGTTGVPLGAKGVLVCGYYVSPSVGAYVQTKPHGASLPNPSNFPILGIVAVANVVTTLSATCPIDSSGQLDLTATNGTITGFHLSIYGYVL